MGDRNTQGAAAAIALLIGLGSTARAQDTRAPVELPPMMREHLLGNMRDHLLTLNQIIADVSAERYVDAARLAEERLGMSSLRAHEAEHFAPYFPKGMQEAGNAMHHAASRFAIAASDSDVDRSYQGLLKLAGALSEITAACAACHARYSIAQPAESASPGPGRPR